MLASAAKPALVASFALLVWVSGCSSGRDAVVIQPGPSNGGTAQAGNAGSPGTSGSAVSSGMGGMLVTPPTGGFGGAELAGSSSTAGASGTLSGGAGGSSSAGSGGGSNADGDTPAPRPLNFQAADGQHVHTVDGHSAGVYGGVPRLMGKLIVQLDNSLYGFGLKRGFHVLGANLPICPINYTTRQHNGDCRLEVFDGVDRVSDFAVTKEESVTGQVTAALNHLQTLYPEEDWGFFLNADGSVRWSDVGFTGHSHRAQSATRFAVAVRAYRAVARSGPRDNTCGTGISSTDFDPAHPPYDPNCSAEKISAWLDDVPKTPIDRFFGFVGKMDEEYGDIQFTMEHMKFVGTPVNVTTGKAPYGGTHRFYADAGHDGFDSAPYYDALNIAWGVPPENAAFALTH
jgi:hypothetical protein